ncbi:MAG: cell cycle regulator GcrA [Candidatus Adlerbacteria bacterium]|nr:cell cycle regulator GcrA [Candidatus Adlerbacteria bacterium]
MTTWTDERTELLKKLWNDGLSASAIAAELGGITRNAVIGKVHRLGLEGRPKAASKRKPRVSQANGRNFNISRPVLNGTPAPAFKPEYEHDPQAELEESEKIIPFKQRLTMLTLSEGVCRWPVGDPCQGSFYFCGGSANAGPYCAYHGNIAYKVVEKRQLKKRGSYR